MLGVRVSPPAPVIPTDFVNLIPYIAGTLWTVFTIDGSSKVITLVNSMSAVVGDAGGAASIE